jgi:hypothetical protein
MPIASPAFVTAYDGDCANCGAHVPAGATAGMVDDDLWCQPCRCDLAARQELVLDELPTVHAIRERQKHYAKTWEQVFHLANRLTE